MSLYVSCLISVVKGDGVIMCKGFTWGKLFRGLQNSNFHQINTSYNGQIEQIPFRRLSRGQRG